MPHRTLREIVGDQDLLHVGSEASVLDAAKRMAERHVAAVLVIDDGQLQGIFTERDLLQRVVAVGLDPAGTPVSKVMTQRPLSVTADQTGFEAVRRMREEGIRHMVVSDLDGIGYGVVSLRDFLGSEMAAFEKELEFEGKLWEEI